MTALAILLSDGNGRGFGDLKSNNPIIGSWAGDRIVVAGDYADNGRFTCDDSNNLYESLNSDEYTDISYKALAAILDDPYIKKSHDKNDQLKSTRPEMILYAK